MDWLSCVPVTPVLCLNISSSGSRVALLVSVGLLSDYCERHCGNSSDIFDFSRVLSAAWLVLSAAHNADEKEARVFWMYVSGDGYHLLLFTVHTQKSALTLT